MASCENQLDSEEDLCQSAASGINSWELLTSAASHEPPPGQHPFSQEAQTEIRSIGAHRCALCLTLQSESGQCAHILDPSETVGDKMVRELS
jgi:hypothetical protein